MKTKEEKIAAVKRVLIGGESKNSVSQRTGIDKHLLNMYIQQYKKHGESAFNEKKRRMYPQKQKEEIINKHLKDNIPLSTLSISYGIPTITLRRWIQAYKKGGAAGLKDKRTKEETPEEIARREQLKKDAHATDLVIERTNQFFEEIGTDLGKQIPQKLIQNKTFENPEFRCFLISFYQALTSPDHRLDEAGAYMFARLSLMVTVPYSKRNKADVILSHEDTTVYLHAFAICAPAVARELEKENDVVEQRNKD